MKKILSFALVFVLMFTTLVTPALAATFAEKVINGWKGDLERVDFIEAWFKEHKNLSGDALWEYLEADYDYVIPLKDVAFDDIAGLESEEAVKTLGKLGIVTGREEGKYFPEASLTRAEMVTILLRVFGQEEYKGDFKFSDVLESHWAYKNVLTAYGMGIVNGTSATTFSPDLALTYEQAVKMLVSALGYDSQAVSKGGWPNGYIAQAEAMNLLGATKPENTASEINRGTMAILINNSIKATELAIDYVDPYKEKIRLKNAPEALEFIALDTPMMNVDRTLATYESCNEWDTLAVLQSKFDNKVIGGVKFDYVGGSWEYRNMDAWQWVRDEKIRMTWGNNMLDEVHRSSAVDPLYEDGLNVVCTTMFGGSEEYANYASLNSFFDKLDEVLVDYPGLKVTLATQCGTGPNNTKFGMFCTGTESVYTKTPCPLSEEYWKVHCFERFALAAQRENIKIVTYDWEMYGADQSIIPGPCFCDDCYNRFLNDRGYTKHEIASVASTERKDSIFASGLYNEYTWYQSECMIDMCQKYVKAIHEINPNLIQAYMPNYETINGISRALGSPWMPSLCMEEGTYTGSLFDHSERQDKVESTGMPLATVIGLWNDPISPDDFAEKMAHSTYISEGFWVYDSSYFRDNANFTYLSDGLERSGALYREAWTEGMDLIKKYLKTGEQLPPEEYEIWEYNCKRVDGVPTEEDWENAEWTRLFAKNNSSRHTGVSCSTKGKMLWDGENLYAQIHNWEEFMDELAPPSEGARDVWSWAKQEVNELYWKFYDSFQGIHLAANRGCNIFDSCITSVGVEARSYTFDVDVDLKDYEDKWVMTFRVPLTVDNTRYAQSGEKIKVLLGRLRNHPTDPYNFCWGTVLGTYITSMGLWGTVNLEQF